MTTGRAIFFAGIALGLGAAISGVLQREWSAISWLTLLLLVGAAAMQIVGMIVNQREIARIRHKADLAFTYSLMNF